MSAEPHNADLWKGFIPGEGMKPRNPHYRLLAFAATQHVVPSRLCVAYLNLVNFGAVNKLLGVDDGSALLFAWRHYVLTFESEDSGPSARKVSVCPGPGDAMWVFSVDPDYFSRVLTLASDNYSIGGMLVPLESHIGVGIVTAPFSGGLESAVSSVLQTAQTTFWASAKQRRVDYAKRLEEALDRQSLG